MIQKFDKKYFDKIKLFIQCPKNISDNLGKKLAPHIKKQFLSIKKVKASYYKSYHISTYGILELKSYITIAPSFFKTRSHSAAILNRSLLSHKYKQNP